MNSLWLSDKASDHCSEGNSFNNFIILLRNSEVFFVCAHSNSIYHLSLKCRLYTLSVVAKKLGSRLKIKLRWLKEGAKRLVLSVEVPVVLYRVLFQPVNFAGSWRLATTLYSWPSIIKEKYFYYGFRNEQVDLTETYIAGYK